LHSSVLTLQSTESCLLTIFLLCSMITRSRDLIIYRSMSVHYVRTTVRQYKCGCRILCAILTRFRKGSETYVPSSLLNFIVIGTKLWADAAQNSQKLNFLYKFASNGPIRCASLTKYGKERQRTVNLLTNVKFHRYW